MLLLNFQISVFKKIFFQKVKFVISSVIKQKIMFTKNFSVALSLVATLLFSNCASAQKHVKGEGSVTIQKKSVSAFSKVSLEASGNVKLIQGAEASVTIETYPNIAELFEIVVESNTLKIRQKKRGMEYYDIDADKLDFVITNPTYDGINLSGSLNISAPEKITVATTDIRVSGSGNIDLKDFHATDAKIIVSGSGNISCVGNADNLDVVVSGSGNIDLFSFPAKTATAKISGSGFINCLATEKYDLKLTGSGFIKYKKTNATVNSKSTGSGNIEMVN